MKKYITIILVAGILVLAFFISKNKTPAEEIVVEETPVVEVPNETKPTDEIEVVAENKYSYTNSEFNFALDLPGLVATKKPNVPSYVSAIFTFGVGDQSNIEEQKRIPNTMVVYIWSDRTEFENMVGSGTKLPSETIKGVKFDVYTFQNEDMITYRYTTTRNGILYDIGVADKSKMNKFTFLK
jgi:hypothetical protein